MDEKEVPKHIAISRWKISSCRIKTTAAINRDGLKKIKKHKKKDTQQARAHWGSFKMVQRIRS